jgi:HSP20 family protein
MRRLSEDFDELFGQVFGNGLVPGMPAALAPPVDFIPAVETFERDGKLVVRADLPGLSPQDVVVEVANGVLTLSGERQEKREVGEKGMRRTELRYGRFMRSIPLPEGTRETDIRANFASGVLEITVPISDEAQASRKIEVQGSQPAGQSAVAA